MRLPMITSSLARALTFFTALMLCVVMSVETLSATDFRVDSRIFQSENQSPDSSSLTIFQDGIIYDFEGNNTITVIAPKFQKIVLIDLKSNIKSELSISQLSDFIKEMSKRAEKSSDATIRFMAQPKFETHQGSNKGERVFQSDQLTYKFEAFVPSQKSIPEQYREYSDLSASLNTLLNHGGPPLARHHANKQLASEGLISTKVTLIIPAHAETNRRKIHLRSEHNVQAEITTEDLEKINQAKSSLEKTTTVALGDYLRRRQK